MPCTWIPPLIPFLTYEPLKDYVTPTNPSEAHLSGFQGVVQTEYLSRVF